MTNKPQYNEEYIPLTMEQLITKLKARRKEVFNDFYGPEPFDSDYERGLVWSELCTLDQVLDNIAEPGWRQN